MYPCFAVAAFISCGIMLHICYDGSVCHSVLSSLFRFELPCIFVEGLTFSQRQSALHSELVSETQSCIASQQLYLRYNLSGGNDSSASFLNVEIVSLSCSYKVKGWNLTILIMIKSRCFSQIVGIFLVCLRAIISPSQIILFVALLLGD